MYNHYIPRPDGSYQRNHIPEPPPYRPAPPSAPEPPPPPGRPVSTFLRNLLPPDFDTGDLIVVLLLLLLAGDCEEERPTALLTLVLYLFL